jgi:hypothetical protein
MGLMGAAWYYLVSVQSKRSTEVARVLGRGNVYQYQSTVPGTWHPH